MDVLAGLLSLTGLSLFLSHTLKRHAAAMPLVAVSASMVWFTLWGIAGFLRLGGWLWYAACFAMLLYVLLKQKKQILEPLSSGLFLFIVGGVLFVIHFAIAKPLFTQWDEFTFWGTAAKAVSQTGQLYTVAQSNLIARSYPPGLIVFSYMMQFFSPGFSEFKMMAAYAILFLAAFTASLPLWHSNRAGGILFFLAFFLLPFFFQPGGSLGQVSYSYLSVMSDQPMAALFGGAIAYYLSSSQKDQTLYLPLCLVLAALTLVKDMGFALALIVLAVVCIDSFFCHWDKLLFFRLRHWKALIVVGLSGLASVLAAYLGWAMHLKLALEQNRFNLGSQGENFSMLAMLVAGIKALVGIQPDEQFSAVAPMMVKALFNKPVSVIGPGIFVFLLIFFITLAAYLCQSKKSGRRRVLVFTLSMFLFFCAFYLFNLFTYAFIFKPQEGLVLKDYARYVAPYWQAWLMGAMLMLAGAAANRHSLRLRIQLARLLSAGVCVLVVFASLLQTNTRANYLVLSPALYGERNDVKQVLRQATEEGMQPQDKVYPIIQGDDATRFYMLGYEMDATRGLLFDGPKLDAQGHPLTNAKGTPIFKGNAAASLVAPGTGSGYDYPVAATKEDLMQFLRQEGSTHILVDRPDEYILKEFGPLFSDGLKGWTLDDTLQVGHRYYQIEWQGDTCRFIPADKGVAQ